MVDELMPHARRGPRGPYAKSKNTKRAILDAALEVFAQSGFRAGSLRDIADRVGISEAGLLHHFPSKSALLGAVLERRDEHTEEQFDFTGESGVDGLRALIALADYNASTPGAVELYSTIAAEATSPDHPAHAYFVERYAVARGLARSALEDLEARGQLRPGVDTARSAATAMAIMDGTQIQWLLDRRSVDMAAALRSYLQSLVTVEL